MDLKQYNSDLEKKVDELEKENAELSEALANIRAAEANESLDLLEKLKAKARETQKLLDARSNAEGAK